MKSLEGKVFSLKKIMLGYRSLGREGGVYEVNWFLYLKKKVRGKQILGILASV